MTSGESSLSVSTPLLLQPAPPSPPPSVPTWASLASGATSGLASCMLLQPMDLLKTRMQQEQQQARSTAAEAVRRNHAAVVAVGRTERLVNLTKQVLREDGWRGLWRGTVPTVARNVPGVAMYFYSVSEVRALLSRSAVPYLSFQNDTSSGSSSSTLARLTVIGNVVSGAAARVVVGFILSPVTIVKARFESSHFSKQAYPSLGRALVEVYRTGGVRGLFRGFSATALRDAPYAGLYMALYEKSKDTLAKMAGSDEARGSSAVVSASGLLAGTMATLLTHPFDILKTRMQTLPQDAIAHDASGGAVTKRSKPPSLLAMMRLIAQTDGMGAYLDGLGLRCARKAASSAIGWTIFEGGRGLWVRRRQDFLERERQSAAAASVTFA